MLANQLTCYVVLDAPGLGHTSTRHAKTLRTRFRLIDPMGTLVQEAGLPLGASLFYPCLRVYWSCERVVNRLQTFGDTIGVPIPEFDFFSGELARISSCRMSRRTCARQCKDRDVVQCPSFHGNQLQEILQETSQISTKIGFPVELPVVGLKESCVPRFDPFFLGLIPHSFPPSFFPKTGFFFLGFRRFSRKKDPWKEWLQGTRGVFAVTSTCGEQ